MFLLNEILQISFTTFISISLFIIITGIYFKKYVLENFQPLRAAAGYLGTKKNPPFSATQKLEPTVNCERHDVHQCIAENGSGTSNTDNRFISDKLEAEKKRRDTMHEDIKNFIKSYKAASRRNEAINADSIHNKERKGASQASPPENITPPKETHSQMAHYARGMAENRKKAAAFAKICTELINLLQRAERTVAEKEEKSSNVEETAGIRGPHDAIRVPEGVNEGREQLTSTEASHPQKLPSQEEGLAEPRTQGKEKGSPPSLAQSKELIIQSSKKSKKTDEPSQASDTPDIYKTAESVNENNTTEKKALHTPTDTSEAAESTPVVQAPIDPRAPILQNLLDLFNSIKRPNQGCLEYNICMGACCNVVLQEEGLSMLSNCMKAGDDVHLKATMLVETIAPFIWTS